MKLISCKKASTVSSIIIRINHFVLFSIGEGGYSKVYEVFDDTNKLMALKVVNLNDTKCKDELMAEIEFLKELKHCEKVIRMIDYEIKDDIQGMYNGHWSFFKKTLFFLKMVWHKKHDL